MARYRRENGDDGGNIRIIPTVVGRYDAEVRERCYEVWATVGAMGYARTARWYAQLAKEHGHEDGDPLPAARTICDWAREDDWHGRRANEIRESRGFLRRFDLDNMMGAAMQGTLQNILNAQSGAFDNPNDSINSGLLRLKAGQDFTRMVERGGIWTVAGALGQDDNEQAPAIDGLTTDQAQAVIRDSIQERKRRSIG